MGRKIMCPECNTVFDENLLKAKNSENICLVCGANLCGDEETDSETQRTNADDVCDTMYFDEIMIFADEPEYNGVEAYCTECDTENSLSFDKFDKMVNKEYVILKDDIVLKCCGCGKEHKSRKILYKPKDHYETVYTPRCPVCQSANLKKITLGSKLFAAGTIGVFALPHTSKTYECKQCGYKF